MALCKHALKNTRNSQNKQKVRGTHAARVTRTDLTHDKLLSSCHMVSLAFCSLCVPWITIALDNFVNVSDKREPAPRFSCSYDPFVFTFHNHENFVLWRLETASKYDCFYIFPRFVTEEACTCGYLLTLYKALSVQKAGPQPDHYWKQHSQACGFHRQQQRMKLAELKRHVQRKTMAAVR